MTDFFNQLTDFVQWIGDIMGRGIATPQTLYDKFDRIKEYVNTYLGNFIHPFFLPLISVMIAIALLHKLFRWGDKE